MDPQVPPPAVPPAFPTSRNPGPPPGPRRRGSCFLYGCGTIVALVLIIVATVAITIWWIQRPIKPVVLSEKEKAVVDAKLRKIDDSSSPAPGYTGHGAFPTNAMKDLKPEPDRVYTPGTNVLILTEREINGLLNSNTDLGQHVRIEFGRDAVNAYLAIPIPKDFPIAPGRTFRARGRFRVSIGNGGEPLAVLEDITVFGISLPKDWLGGIKGENLLSNATGEHNGKPVLRGIKSLRVEPGALMLQLED